LEVTVLSWKFVNDRPIYMQLVEQMQLKILSGEYQAGQKLASVRDLAAEAAVNPNTMQKALAELEKSGLLYSERTTGRFITDDTDKITQIRRMYAEKSVLEFLEQMKGLGFDTEETIRLISGIIREESK